MKIVFFARLFYPHIGGVEKHVLEVGKRLVEKGHEVTVITEKLSTTDIPIYLQLNKNVSFGEEIEGIKTVRINAGENNWFKKFRIWKEIWKKRKIIKEADIIHCHDVFFWYLPFRFLFPIKKVFTTFHGYEGNNIPLKKAILMHKIAEVLSFGNICVGEFLKKWYGTKPNQVTYGGVQINLNLISKFNIQTKFKVQSSKFKDEWKIVYIGRLEEEAGIMEYLKALKILKEKGFKFSIDALGDGKQRKEAEDFCKKNNLNVNFIGFVEDVNKYLDNADLVFTSRYLGILEALAKKKIVFAVYNNAIKRDYLEMATFSKFISISYNSADLAEEIINVIENKKESLKNIEKGYEWVKNETWEKMVSIYLKLWRV